MNNKFSARNIWIAVLVFVSLLIIFASNGFLRLNFLGGAKEGSLSAKPEWEPTIKDGAIELRLSTDAFLSVFVKENDYEKILAEKNKDAQLPIASITKLVTALVASEQYTNDDVIILTGNSLKERGASKIYMPGSKLLFDDALRALLIASHNEIASALAEQAGVGGFIDAMNQRAQAIGLQNTIFFNSIGIDPLVDSKQINLSTALDIYKLVRHMQELFPDILSITAQNEYPLSDASGEFIATIQNTNDLLSWQESPFTILGGKTGETPRAKQNLVIFSDSPCGGKIFSVVLGSQNNFADMKALLMYANDSYLWSCPIDAGMN
ncbi:MAG: serine hydrolase [Candidatus Colwellbacteria bacterium]|nr:serine hydrolase [Candidatus Colwellbacteria bacterium]